MLIFAHRGASAEAPENTLAAIELALQQGADGIEIDVWQHHNQYYVIHDKWLNRTTNGSGQLADYSAQQLSQLDAGSGESIPLLQDVVQMVGNRCVLNIELKGISSVNALLSDLRDIQRRFEIDSANWLVSSFNHHWLAQLQQRGCPWRIGALTASNPIHRGQFASQLGAWSVHGDHDFINKAFIDDCHQRGLKILAYTVDHQEDFEQLRVWGVDGVFTNYPARMKSFLAQA